MDRTIWLTSDTHLNHDKDFIWGVRGFKSVEEMNETIIENWNSTVKDNDIVYHLGDVMMGELQAGLHLVKKLKGEKYLAYGNHDTDSRIKAFDMNRFFKDIQMGYRLKVRKKSLILSHYPQLVANQEDKTPVWSIHGHTHSKDKFSEVFHTYNVNMDAHACYPINLEDLMMDIKNKGCINEH